MHAERTLQCNGLTRHAMHCRRAGPTRPGKADDGNHLDVSVERGVSASSVDVGTLAAMNPPEPPSRDAVQVLVSPDPRVHCNDFHNTHYAKPPLSDVFPCALMVFCNEALYLQMFLQQEHMPIESASILCVQPLASDRQLQAFAMPA